MPSNSAPWLKQEGKVKSCHPCEHWILAFSDSSYYIEREFRSFMSMSAVSL